MSRALRTTCRFAQLARNRTRDLQLVTVLCAQSHVPVRWGRTVAQQHLLRDLYKRRVAAGPEPERPRSAWSDWNYSSEIYSFGKRLGEDFNEQTIKRAFMHRSYVEKQEAEAAGAQGEEEGEQGLLGSGLAQEDNADLIAKGEDVLNNFSKAFLRHHFPRMPEECICSVHSFLTTDEKLSYIGIRVGIKDLILTAEELPFSDVTIAKTFKAVIGALAEDQGQKRAEKFIQDFVMTQLVGKDINEYLGIINPMGLLRILLEKQSMAEPEPRLIHSSGSSTLRSVYMVGVYCDRQLIGKSYGETAIIAEEMAARDALRNMFGTTLHRTPLPFKAPVNIESSNYQENYKVPEYFNHNSQLPG